jgi:hypothetical protein
MNKNAAAFTRKYRFLKINEIDVIFNRVPELGH